MKKHIKSIIVSSVAALTFGAIGVGTTFALFTSRDENTVNIGSGKINISFSASNVQTYSINYNQGIGSRIDENNVHYESKETAVNGEFTNGGTASYANGVLALDKVTPGDRVTFDVSFEDNSNVDYKYRLVYELIESKSGDQNDPNKTLAKGLSTTTDISGTTNSYSGLVRYASEWTMVHASQENPEEIRGFSFDIELPANKGNQYQDKSAKFKLYAEAVQGNAYTENEEGLELLEEDMVSPSATVVEEQDTVVTASNASQTASVTATIPAAATQVQANDKVTLEISEVSTSTATTTNTLSIGFDATLKVNNNVVSSFSEPVKIELNIGTGKDIAKITHHTSQGDVEITDYEYNSTTGKVTFYSQTFSPFTVEYYDLAPIASYPVRVGKVGFETLQAAIDSIPVDGNEYTATVQQDIVNDVLYTKGAQKVRLNLDNHNITCDQTAARPYLCDADGNLLGPTRGIILANLSSSIIIENGSLNFNPASGYSGSAVICRGATAILDNVSITANDKSSSNMAINNISGNVTIKGDSDILCEKGNTISLSGQSTLTIDGEEVTVSNPARDVIDNQQSTVILNKGTISYTGTSNNPSAYCVKNTANSQYAPSFIMNGGLLTTGQNCYPCNDYSSLNGGTFDRDPRIQNPSASTYNHYEVNGDVIENGNGTWSVVNHFYHVTADNSNNYYIDGNGVKTQLTASWSDIIGSGDHGDVWTLNPDTGLYEKPIEHGLATNGDTVYFENGVYYVTGKLYVAHGVTLIGQSREGVFIGEDGSSHESNLNANGDLTVKNMTFLGCKKVYAITPNLQGLSSETNPKEVDAMLAYQANFVIENCDFRLRTNFTEKMYAINFQSYYGNLTVRNCYFNVGPGGIGICGLRTNGGARFVIEGNTFENCGSAIDYVGENFAENQSALWEAANTLINCPINRF